MIRLRIISNAQALIVDAPLAGRRGLGDPALHPHPPGSPGSVVPGFTPDLVKTQNTLDMAIMVMF